MISTAVIPLVENSNNIFKIFQKKHLHFIKNNFILESVETNIKTTNKKNKNMKVQAKTTRNDFDYEVIRLVKKKS